MSMLWGAPWVLCADVLITHAPYSSEHTVADVMSRDVKSLPPRTEVAAAAEFMNASGIHRVLVMTDEHLDGIVSSMDIVDAVAKHHIPAPQLVFSPERPGTSRAAFALMTQPL